ncbi:MAG: hypothetical protein H6737_26175 [Alphaproteobacteria bacterium]|nr:hypothetical protein [Alphaproteobacteria bacterium]
MILAWLIACGGAPVGDPEQPEPAVEARSVAEDAAEDAAEDDPSWGDTCVPTNELGCVGWGRKARKLQQDYREFLEPSCERGYGPSCFYLAMFLGEDGSDASVTTPLYERACNMGDPNGCMRWAQTLEGDAQRPILEKGCALRCVWCCEEAGLPAPTW